MVPSSSRRWLLLFALLPCLLVAQVVDSPDHRVFVKTLVRGCNDSRDVGVGDFNGDGYADIACPCKGVNEIIVALGDGNGEFSRYHSVKVEKGRNHPRAIAVDDLNGDGIDDMVIGYSSPGLSVFYGPSFTERHARAPEMINAVRIFDIDNDGKKDIVWIAQEKNRIGFMRLPELQVVALPKLSLLVHPLKPPKKLHSILVSDLDNDQKPDLLFLDNYIPPTLVSNAFTFEKASSRMKTSIGPIPEAVMSSEIRVSTLDDRYHSGARDACAADIDGDAILDTVVAYKTTDEVAWYDAKNQTRHVICDPGTCRFACALVCADFDGDHRVDVAVAQKNSGQVDLFLQPKKNPETTSWRRVPLASVTAVSGLQPITFHRRSHSSKGPDGIAFVGRGATTTTQRRRRRRRSLTNTTNYEVASSGRRDVPGSFGIIVLPRN